MYSRYVCVCSDCRLNVDDHIVVVACWCTELDDIVKNIFVCKYAHTEMNEHVWLTYGLDIIHYVYRGIACIRT